MSRLGLSLVGYSTPCQQHEVVKKVEDARGWLVNGAHDGHATSLTQSAQFLYHGICAVTVQTRGGLVAEQQRGVSQQLKGHVMKVSDLSPRSLVRWHTETLLKILQELF